MTIYFLPAPYHALRGNVFFDALRHGETTGYTSVAKKINLQI